jgi:hypothetical protein
LVTVVFIYLRVNEITTSTISHLLALLSKIRSSYVGLSNSFRYDPFDLLRKIVFGLFSWLPMIWIVLQYLSWLLHF